MNKLLLHCIYRLICKVYLCPDCHCRRWWTCIECWAFTQFVSVTIICYNGLCLFDMYLEWHNNVFVHKVTMWNTRELVTSITWSSGHSTISGRQQEQSCITWHTNTVAITVYTTISSPSQYVPCNWLEPEKCHKPKTTGSYRKTTFIIDWFTTSKSPKPPFHCKYS